MEDPKFEIDESILPEPPFNEGKIFMVVQTSTSYMYFWTVPEALRKIMEGKYEIWRQDLRDACLRKQKDTKPGILFHFKDIPDGTMYAGLPEEAMLQMQIQFAGSKATQEIGLKDLDDEGV